MAPKPKLSPDPQVQAAATALLAQLRPVLAKSVFARSRELTEQLPDLGSAAEVHAAMLLAVSRGLSTLLHEEGRIAVDRYVETRIAEGLPRERALRRLGGVMGLARTSVMVAFGRPRRKSAR